MKGILFIFLLLICLFPAILYAGVPVYRYGLFIASSKAYNLPELSTAGNVVQGVVRLFEEYCRVEDYQFLENPGNDTLNLAFDKAEQIIAVKSRDFEIQFFFYYYGHGMPEGFWLGDELYSKSLLKEKMISLKARIKFIFIDACTSEVMGEEGYINFNNDSDGTVFITSSTLFQNSYTDIFTPVLKAGLMGDADGYIPVRFPTKFFYDEVINRLDSREGEIIRNFYNFKEFYDYNYETPFKELDARKLFTALGMETIPQRLHISTLHEKIFSGLVNSREKQLVQRMYNYNEVCSQKEHLSLSEKVLLKDILEKAGIKKDNFITLTELFSYIRDKMASGKVVQQTPTINTGNFLSREPVRLSYINNKVPLILNLGGTIYINRVISGNILENLTKFFPRLGDNTPAQIALLPGKYIIIVETENFKYQIEQELFTGDKEVIIEQPDWSAVIAFSEEVPVNGIMEKQWIPKKEIEHKIIREKNISQIFSVTSLLSLSVPVTLLASGFYYHTLSSTLYAQYNKTTNPYTADALHNRILDLDETTRFLYIWAAVSVVLPVLAFSIWTISLNKYNQYNAELEQIKSRLLTYRLPDIQLDSEKLVIAFRWQIT